MTRLIDLKKGQSGVVSSIDTNNENILRKLMSMGILPGMPLKVIQTFPTYVFQVGFTQVALDKTIASAIVIDV